MSCLCFDSLSCPTYIQFQLTLWANFVWTSWYTIVFFLYRRLGVNIYITNKVWSGNVLHLIWCVLHGATLHPLQVCYTTSVFALLVLHAVDSPGWQVVMKPTSITVVNYYCAWRQSVNESFLLILLVLHPFISTFCWWSNVWLFDMILCVLNSLKYTVVGVIFLPEPHLPRFTTFLLTCEPYLKNFSTIPLFCMHLALKKRHFYLFCNNLYDKTYTVVLNVNFKIIFL